MIALITGSLLLSFLHAVIPNHWLPILAIAKKENWSLSVTMKVTFISGLAHAASTVLIGAMLAFVGARLSTTLESFTGTLAPLLLILLGAFYIYQHSRHHHFHLHGHPEQVGRNRLVFSLAAAMFFTPCFEIEPYFLVAGAQGYWFVFLLSTLYTVVTVTGMVMWVRLAYKGLLRMNWHSLEHNAGIITGTTLVVSGILTYFLR